MADEKTVTQETETPAPATVADKTVTGATDTAEVTTDPDKPGKDWVPHQAFHQERMTRRRLERDLAEARMWKETSEKRLDDLYKKFAPAEPKAPDPNDDPVGALTHETRTTRQQLEEMRRESAEEKKTREQKEQAQAQEQHIVGAFQRGVAQLKAEKPDFDTAYTFVWNDVVKQFSRTYGQEQAQKLAYNYWRDIVVNAERNEENPASIIYDLAQMRGYKTANGEDKIDTIAKGTQAASPLSSAGGKGPSRLTAEAIATMKQEDFDKLTDADFKRAMGG